MESRNQFVTFYCHCGHHATVQLSGGPWREREWLLPRARCSVCGRLGAQDLRAAIDPEKLWHGEVGPMPRWGDP